MKPAAAKLPPRTAPSTCVYGTVRTAGDMVLPVTKARIYLMSGGELLGETYTDADGQYVWCMATELVRAGIEASIFVEKPPFVPSSQDRRLEPGRHLRLDVAMEAPGLTDG